MAEDKEPEIKAQASAPVGTTKDKKEPVVNKASGDVAKTPKPVAATSSKKSEEPKLETVEVEDLDLDSELTESRSSLLKKIKRPPSPKTIIENFAIVLKSPLSTDPETRQSGRWFYLGVIVFILTLYGAGGGFSKHEKIVEKITHEEVVAESGDYITMRAGSFFIPFRRTPIEDAKNEPLSLAAADIYLVCDEATTCTYMEKYLDYIQDQVEAAIGTHVVSREELLSYDGKQKIKDEIVRRVNQWLKHGKVKEVIFTKLVIG